MGLARHTVTCGQVLIYLLQYRIDTYYKLPRVLCGLGSRTHSDVRPGAAFNRSLASCIARSKVQTRTEKKTSMRCARCACSCACGAHGARGASGVGLLYFAPVVCAWRVETGNHDHGKTKNQCGVIPRLRISATIPGGYPEYPDPLRGGFLAVVVKWCSRLRHCTAPDCACRSASQT